MTQRIRWLTLDASVLALIALLSLLPFGGYIPLPGFGISVTILHVVVMIFAYFGGIKRGWLYGLFFGIMSLVRAATMPSGVLDPFFVNPLISILPRVLFGFLAGLAFEFIKKIPDRKTLRVVTVIACGILTLLHSVMTLGMLGICNFREVEATFENTPFMVLLGSTLLTSSLPECIVAMILAPIVIFPIIPVFQRVILIDERSRR